MFHGKLLVSNIWIFFYSSAIVIIYFVPILTILIYRSNINNYESVDCNHCPPPPGPGNSGDFEFRSSQSRVESPPWEDTRLVKSTQPPGTSKLRPILRHEYVHYIKHMLFLCSHSLLDMFLKGFCGLLKPFSPTQDTSTQIFILFWTHAHAN